ncbi:MAG: type IV pilin protein [Pseudomarimonas sp.]
MTKTHSDVAAQMRDHRSLKMQGFTLIELVITISIIALLLAIAIPAYNSQVRNTRRSTAKADIMNVVQGMERFSTLNRTFVGAPCPSLNDFYTVTCTNLAALTYTITAAPIAGTAQEIDQCGSLIVNQTGARTIVGAAVGVTVDDCW